MVHEKAVTVLLTASDEADCLNGDVMGYLRNGRLLVEDSPRVLLQSYNVTNISKLLYCVAIADHHLSVGEKSLTNRTESTESIESGGFTVTDQDVTAVVCLSDSTIGRPTHMLLTQKSKLSWLTSSICRYCCGRTLVRSRQLSRFVRIWTLVQSSTLSLCRAYLFLLAYLLLPIILIAFYYYSVKDVITISLGVGKRV